MWELYREEFYHIMCMVRSLLLSIYCAVFTVYFCLFLFWVCFVFLFVHCTFVGSCAVVNVR